ncbi:hypothetical protein DJ568_12840 [Mucilaginibacter hurinus]|uniref:Cysteine-rich CWC family protein n=1 Tax=Mucilaginibacter hurinus TaxID=2201324 RepID=A0A367GMC1_9SPHI|nr:cysteine-rich CWC family protein [Mucilaginibacter hurinus]RCH54185.1 hypothetical protein DJ568_12840 [Mucilaginibacter hurinus]
MPNTHSKHEVIRCERCSAPFECKANSFTKCQCSTVQLSLNETQYVSEHYDGCLCAKCLLEVQLEYKEMFVSPKLQTLGRIEDNNLSDLRSSSLSD